MNTIGNYSMLNSTQSYDAMVAVVGLDRSKIAGMLWVSAEFGRYVEVKAYDSGVTLEVPCAPGFSALIDEIYKSPQLTNALATKNGILFSMKPRPEKQSEWDAWVKAAHARCAGQQFVMSLAGLSSAVAVLGSVDEAFRKVEQYAKESPEFQSFAKHFIQTLHREHQCLNALAKQPTKPPDEFISQ